MVVVVVQFLLLREGGKGGKENGAAAAVERMMDSNSTLTEFIILKLKGNFTQTLDMLITPLPAYRPVPHLFFLYQTSPT